jgi:putative ABC transport system permease protein
MLGVVIGSAALVLVVTISSTAKYYLVSQIEGIGSNLAYASLDLTDNDTVLDDELTPADLLAVQNLSIVHAAAGTYDEPADFHFRNRPYHARLVGVTEEFEKIRNLRITAGRYFDAQDFASHFKVCLVTDQLARSAFGYAPAIGSTLIVNEFRCTLIGTFREGVPTFGQSEIQEKTLLVPFTLIKEITGDNFFQVIYAQAASTDEVEIMTRQFGAVLRSRHRKQAHYSVDNLAALVDTARKISLALTGVLIAIALLTLVTAGTGIMNIMLVNVSQRIPEIGMRKALGARPAEIRMQFLLEAFLISFTGGIAGIVAAVGIVWPVASLIQDVVPVSIPWIAAAIGLVVSSGVGVLFGYRPASEAANLNPIDAIRME